MKLDNIRINTQSSIRIQAEKVLYFDPIEISSAPQDADLIFITHEHYDHFSPEDLRRLAKENTILVVPEQMVQVAKEKTPFVSIISVRPGCSYEICGYHVETAPSYNKLKPFHPKRKEWCGYIVEINGLRYYVAGDTDCLEENCNIKCDVALVPIGGTYTMDAQQAAKLINRIRPQLAIPTHYGSIVGRPEDRELFREKVDSGIDVQLLL